MRPWMLAVLLLSLVYQMVMLPLYRVSLAGPDFVFMALCYLAIYETHGRALGVAVLLGLLVDGLSLDPWGVHIIGYGVAVGFLTLAQREGWGHGFASRLVLLCLATAIAATFRAVILWDGGDPRRFTSLAWMGACAVYTALLGPVVFGLLDPLRGRLVTPRYRRLM